eukprot:TRINITY_DN2093_c0_g1_i1.p1 TRINITY_DN2093_c0_g1~~TRINITY_DN2093_c0_g1_i1.p1  ORF type:complete len:975 (-),score=170.65 TRINITY_DN2093_c0_g1_i1:84-3008(-)
MSRPKSSAIKLGWVDHVGCPIWSVHVHPHGKYFATSGGDHKVKIWSTDHLFDIKTEGTMLAELSHHSNGVNCVRWSPNGKYLATCSDDQSVVLCVLGDGPARQTYGQPTNLVNWQVKSVGKRHSSDVVDLAWAPDSSKLASCSLDNTVIIWEVVNNQLEAKHILKGHKGHVKGVSWDPMGQYLASHGDDGKLIIWSVESGRAHKKTCEMYENLEESYFRRMSWAPDGSVLFTSSGLHNGHYVAPMVARSNWKPSQQLVGHTTNIVCCACTANAYESSDAKEIGTLIACGSKDGALSVWFTHSARPLLVFKDVVKSIMDLAWSADGEHLFVSSMEGTVVVIKLPPLCRKLSQEEFIESIKNTYGEQYLQGKLFLVPDPCLLQLAAKKTAAPPKTQKPQDAQNTKKTMKKDGKVFDYISLDTDGEEDGSADDSGGSMEEEAPAPKAMKFTFAPTVAPATTTTTTQPGGKKRITPIFLGTLGTTLPTTTGTTFSAPTTITTSTPVSVASAQAQAQAQAQAPQTTTTATIATTTTTTTTTATAATAAKASATEEPALKRKRVAEEETPNKKRRSREDAEEDSIHRTPVKSPSALGRRRPRALSTNVIDLPKIRDKFTKEVVMAKTTNQPTQKLFFEATFDIPSNTSQLRYWKATPSKDKEQKSQVLWSDSIRDKVTACTSVVTSYVAVGCYSGDIYLFCTTGRRMFPCIVSGNSPVARLDTDMNGEFLSCISCDGTMNLWNMKLYKKIWSDSVSNLVAGGRIHSVEVSNAGQVIIITKGDAGQAYIYHQDMKSWLRVADSKSFKNSEFNSPLLQGWTEVRGPVFRAQFLANVDGGNVHSFLGVNTDKQKIDTIGHLESQLVSSIVLGSKAEYQKWLEMYVRKLTEEIHSVDDPEFFKLEKFCREELLGPVYLEHDERPDATVDSNDTGPLPDGSWNPYIFGLSKRELLFGLLPILSKNNKLGKLVLELKDYLDTMGIN